MAVAGIFGSPLLSDLLGLGLALTTATWRQPLASELSKQRLAGGGRGGQVGGGFLCASIFSPSNLKRVAHKNNRCPNGRYVGEIRCFLSLSFVT